MTSQTTATATLTVPIIGVHHSPLGQKFGTPRQPNLVAITSHIELFAPFANKHAVQGLEQFSHLWITWHFHKNKPSANFRAQVRPPRLGGNDKMGVFATRSMYRPAPLGLSVVALTSIDTTDGVNLHIQGADFIDGTPIIDIKPYLPYSDCLTQATSRLDKPSARQVTISPVCQSQLDSLVQNGSLSASDCDCICALIAQDPRPAYKQALYEQFTMRYGAFDVLFFDDGNALVLADIHPI